MLWKTIAKYAGVAILLVALGIAIGWVPSMVQDLLFLHEARLNNEAAARMQKLQPPPSSGHIVPGAPPEKGP